MPWNTSIIAWKFIHALLKGAFAVLLRFIQEFKFKWLFEIMNQEHLLTYFSIASIQMKIISAY